MDLVSTFATATGLAAGGVWIATELLKLIPVQFTSKYPAWVNLICSAIAAVFAVAPTVHITSGIDIFATTLLIAVLAAMVYNHFGSKIVNLNSPAS